jgi:hypothetical protein
MASQLIDQARILIDQAAKLNFQLPEELLKIQDALDELNRNFDRISAVATNKRKTNESLVVNESLLEEQKQLLEEVFLQSKDKFDLLILT